MKSHLKKMTVAIKKPAKNDFTQLSQKKMKQIPAQFYVLLLCLSLYFLPLSSFFTGSKAEYFPVGCVIAQLVIIILWNKIVSEKWIAAVIGLEIASMAWNMAVFINWHDLSDIFYTNYDQFSTCTFILQLLIISISLRGENVGNTHSRHSPRARNSNILCRDFRIHPNRDQEITQ